MRIKLKDYAYTLSRLDEYGQLIQTCEQNIMKAKNNFLFQHNSTIFMNIWEFINKLLNIYINIVFDS